MRCSGRSEGEYRIQGTERTRPLARRKTGRKRRGRAQLARSEPEARSLEGVALYSGVTCETWSATTATCGTSRFSRWRCDLGCCGRARTASSVSALVSRTESERERGTHRRLVVGLAQDLLVEDAARRGDEAEEGRRRVERARAELGVRLEADKVLVVCAHRKEEESQRRAEE